MILIAFWLPYIVGASVVTIVLCVAIGIVLDHVSLYGAVRSVADAGVAVVPARSKYHELFRQIAEDFPSACSAALIGGESATECSDVYHVSFWTPESGYQEKLYKMVDGVYRLISSIIEENQQPEEGNGNEANWWDENRDQILELNDRATREGQLTVVIPVEMYGNEYEAA